MNNEYQQAFSDLTAKLDEHRAARPNSIRSIFEALGLVEEEKYELTRGVRKTDVGDSVDAVLNDALELAMISASSYIDLTALAKASSRTAAPHAYQEAFSDVIQKLDAYRNARATSIRSTHEALGLCTVYYDKFSRHVRRTDVGDPWDAVLDSLCELAMIAMCAYIDLSAQAQQAAGGLARGGFDCVCTSCRQRQAWHQRGGAFLCDRCVRAA